jgi:hypothetical protein
MKGCERIQKNCATRLGAFLRQRSPVFYPWPQMLDGSGAGIEILVASVCDARSIPITFRGEARRDLPQGIVDTCQEKQGKAGEESRVDAVPPKPKGYGSCKYRDRWKRVVSPFGRQIKTHGLLGLFSHASNPLVHPGCEGPYPTLDVGDQGTSRRLHSYLRVHFFTPRFY